MLTGIGRVLLQMSSPAEETSSEKERKLKFRGPGRGTEVGSGCVGGGESGE